MLNDTIIELKEQLTKEIPDKLLFWDFLKMKMRNIIMKYSKEKQNEEETKYKH